MALSLDNRIKFLRDQLTFEYVKAGTVTPKVLHLSERLDRLIVDYLNSQRCTAPAWGRLNRAES